jgi:tetratricopeptide (TPR) repeat protein
MNNKTQQHMSKIKQIQNNKQEAKVISVHTNPQPIDENQTLLQQAEAAEKNSNYELAEKLYKKQLNLKTFNEFIYKRLMIIYRKQKRYKEELDIINRGLEHFEEDRINKSTEKNTSATVKRLSNSLNKSLGLTNNKGKLLYEPEPVPSWKKRKAIVQKKLKKQ